MNSSNVYNGNKSAKTLSTPNHINLVTWNLLKKMLLRFSIQKSFVPMCIAFLFKSVFYSRHFIFIMKSQVTLMKPKALFLKLNPLLFVSNPPPEAALSGQNQSHQHFIVELTCLGETGGKPLSVFLQ